MTEGDDATAALLADYPVTIEVPLQWGDQDAFGHVNHARYFRWFETARILYAERVGLMRMHREEKVGPILASVGADYRRQLKFPDTIRVGVRVARIGLSSIGLEHRIVSTVQQALAAEGTSTLVIFDYNHQRPVRVPEPLRRAIENLEGRELPRS